jgi:hypothetical protein
MQGKLAKPAIDEENFHHSDFVCRETQSTNKFIALALHYSDLANFLLKPKGDLFSWTKENSTQAHALTCCTMISPMYRYGCKADTQPKNISLL